MFLEKLKRQYSSWCFFACGTMLFNIIENIQAFDLLRLLVNAFMVLVMAFLFYCIVYCVCAVLSFMGVRLPKFLSALLIAFVLFSGMTVADAEANQVTK